MEQPKRTCFVTVGSIASFRPLLAEILRPRFLETLRAYGYDALEVQCGPDYQWFRDQVGALTESYGIVIRGFDYTSAMMEYMVRCRSESGVRHAGCVISHAGAGSILEALRYQAPLIVVPNPALMGNHQEELAEECEKQQWAVYGRLGHLEDAVRRSRERVEQGRLDDLPPYTEPSFPVPEDQRITVFDWMVLTCYPEEYRKQVHVRRLQGVDPSPQPVATRPERASEQRALQMD